MPAAFFLGWPPINGAGAIEMENAHQWGGLLFRFGQMRKIIGEREALKTLAKSEASLLT